MGRQQEFEVTDVVSTVEPETQNISFQGYSFPDGPVRGESNQVELSLAINDGSIEYYLTFFVDGEQVFDDPFLPFSESQDYTYRTDIPIPDSDHFDLKIVGGYHG